MAPSLTLDGKTAIVTGAGHGLGRAEAIGLATAGARLVLNDLAGPAVHAVADEITAAGGEAVACEGDIAEWSTGEAMIATALGSFGGLDIVVNNAGVLRDPRISCLVETGEQYFDLRGVLVQGVARRIEDPAAIANAGRLIATVLSGTDDPDPEPTKPPGTSPNPNPAKPEPTEPPGTSPNPNPAKPYAAPPGSTGPAQADALTEYAERAARKRYAYTVEPSRIIS